MVNTNLTICPIAPANAAASISPGPGVYMAVKTSSGSEKVPSPIVDQVPLVAGAVNVTKPDKSATPLEQISPEFQVKPLEPDHHSH